MPATIIAPGRLTKDAEQRAAGQSQVVSFSVAVNCYERKEKVTRFYDCSWFGKRADSMLNILRKGTAVTVTGAHSSREHNGKTYEQIEVWNVELQGGGQRAAQPAEQAPEEYQGGNSGTIPDDGFPF